MHIATIILVVVAILTLLGGLARYIHNTGLNGGKLAGKLDENTRATERLTQSFDKHADRVDAKLEDHEHRITVLETELH